MTDATTSQGPAVDALSPPPAGRSVADPFEHLGMLYRGDDQYLAGTVGFIRSGLAAGDPVMVAVPGRNLDLIRETLGAQARHVRFLDMAVAGRNPGRIIPGVLLAFVEAHAGRRSWIIGEPIWPGRTQVEYPACAAHEALINVAFTGRAASILCPYDVAGLDPDSLTDSETTHPIMLDGPHRRLSHAYGDPFGAALRFNRPLPEPPAGAAVMRFDGYRSLAGVRRFVARQAQAAGLSEGQQADLIISVNELATNTSEHGGGAGLLTVWVEGDTLVCQITDKGHLDDPLAGRIPPAPDQRRGRGLFLVNQLCDLVRVHSTADGTTIRLHMSR
jgi:anti-sigma regulatory factor (Ser/Thr protein kinase)